MKPTTARLLIWCPDQSGIIAAVTGFLAQFGANILEADQHSDPDDRTFCMRLEFDVEPMNLSREAFAREWSTLADRYRMDWRIAYSDQRCRMVILVGRQDHCLHDLLWRWQRGEIDAEIPLVISNHPDLQGIVDWYGPSFRHLPISGQGKIEQERELLALLAESNADMIVLARYMQVLSGQVVQRYPSRIINIHHSFLPAFAGGRPYHQAYERGVKIVGATAHYVTEQLDAGPIISQGTVSINHRDTVQDLIRKGRDLERTVLATAVRLHLEDKVLVHQNRTIVFD